MLRASVISLIMAAFSSTGLARANEPPRLPPPSLPEPGKIVIDQKRGEVLLSAMVQHPTGKPCIDQYGQRIQAFVGCATAAGGEAKMAGYFVFLVDVPTETVYEGLVRLGARTKVHYSMQEGHQAAASSRRRSPMITSRVILWYSRFCGRMAITGLNAPISIL